MPLITRVLIATIGLGIMLVIVHLVRRKQLDEKYALLWLVGGLAMIVMPLSVQLIDMVSVAIGISYPPAFVFLIAFFALCLICLQYSVTLTRLTRHNKTLAQRLALLEQRVREAEQQSAASQSSTSQSSVS